MLRKAPAHDDRVKNLLLIKGKSTSQVVSDVLKDLSMMSKPNCKALNGRNDIQPFEDANSLEFLCQKNNCSMFAFVSSTKKRPNNLVLGRTYDGHILDMIEFGVDEQICIQEILGEKKGVGSKPLLVFQGDQWENDTTYKNIKNLLIDIFRGDNIEKISLTGVDHVVSCSCVDGKIFVRTYTLGFSKSNSKTPDVSLNAMGPFLDLTVRRTQLPAPDTWKDAVRIDKSQKSKKVKNVSSSSIGDKVGRIHMKKQNLDTMGGRRVSALRDRVGSKKRVASATTVTATGSSSVKRRKSA